MSQAYYQIKIPVASWDMITEYITDCVDNHDVRRCLTDAQLILPLAEAEQQHDDAVRAYAHGRDTGQNNKVMSNLNARVWNAAQRLRTARGQDEMPGGYLFESENLT